MPSTSAPFGLRPAFHGRGGIIRPVARTIVTGYASNILQFQPVKIGTDGTVQAAGAGDRFVGTFQGVEYTDSDGRRRESNKWLANTAATDIVAYITEDPGIVYEIQTNATVAIGDIGKEYDFTAASGSTTTGLSSQMLDVASSAANAGLQLLNASPYAGNAFDDTYVIVQVRISEHQLVADVAAF